MEKIASLTAVVKRYVDEKCHTRTQRHLFPRTCTSHTGLLIPDYLIIKTINTFSIISTIELDYQLYLLC